MMPISAVIGCAVFAGCDNERNRKRERLTFESIGIRTQKLSEGYPDQFS